MLLISEDIIPVIISYSAKLQLAKVPQYRAFGISEILTTIIFMAEDAVFLRITDEAASTSSRIFTFSFSLLLLRSMSEPRYVREPCSLSSITTGVQFAVCIVIEGLF